jgi:hypothetical protein
MDRSVVGRFGGQYLMTLPDCQYTDVPVEFSALGTDGPLSKNNPYNDLTAKQMTFYSNKKKRNAVDA